MKAIGPTVPRMALGEQLAKAREQAQVTLDDAAAALDCTVWKIRQIESGKTGLRKLEFDQLVELYGLDDDTRARLDQIRGMGRRRGWYVKHGGRLKPQEGQFLGIESAAIEIRTWQSAIVPGLLQTEAYAREVVGGWQQFVKIAPSGIDSRVSARLARQGRLQGEGALRLWAVVDESALWRRFGGNDVMRSQLEHLIDVSQLPNVTVRVLSLDGRQPVGTGAFIYFSFPRVYDVRLDDIVWLEQLTANFQVSRRNDVYQYSLAFDELFDKSLPPGPSRDVMADVIGRKWS